MQEVGRGAKVTTADPVRGRWRVFSSPDDVIDVLDSGGAEGLVACVGDAGATFLAPIFEEFAAVVCLSGTPQSHIGIVSREHQIPCVMGAAMTAEPADGTEVEVDCSGAEGIVRTDG